MAAFAQAAEDELLCPICFELFVDPNTPKILPACGHVCCEVCLKKMVAEEMAKTCPECRKEICLPKGGVTSFLTNFRLRNLAEKHGHKVPEPVNKQICPDHEEKMHYFCTTCNMPACQVCLTLKHKGDKHVIGGIKEMHSKQKGQMQAAFITEGEDELQHFAGLETKARNPHVHMEKQIDESIELHIKQLRKQGNELKQLQQAADNELVKVNKKLASVKQKVRSIPVMSDRPRKIKLIQTLHGFEKVTHISHSPTGLLAVSGGPSKEVSVYHKVNGKYEKKLNLNLNLNPSNEMYIPRDVTILPDGRFMVTRLLCIEVYSPEGNYLNNIKTAASGLDMCPSHQVIAGVTTTSDGRILAGDIGRSAIIELDQTGNIVRALKTNICPRYMTLINDTHIAMSDFNAGKVSVMDMETGQETLSIDIPLVWGVSYDEQTQCLLITTWRLAPGFDIHTSGVINQYSYTTGKLVASLEQGLSNPKGMTMIGDANLAVTNGETVNIYKLK